MNVSLKCLALVPLFSLAACGSTDISKSSQVLARVGDKEITTSYFERQLGSLPESIQKISAQGQGKKVVLEAFVNRELLYADALKNKVDKSADLERKFQDLKKELIINTYLQSRIADKIKVEDKEVENFYNANPAEFKNRQEMRISQIVVPDEATAGQMLQKLSIGREFGELAQVHSIDKVSAARKGDVGYFSYKRLPVEMRDAVFNLRVGGVSKPYKMPDGYEIYQVTDKRVVSASFEQVKDALKSQIYNDKLQKELKSIVDELKKTIKVQLNESLLK
jgi:peptidyl-prolyl cis-trans isomerase C